MLEKIVNLKLKKIRIYFYILKSLNIFAFLNLLLKFDPKEISKNKVLFIIL
jgi:hypothetical protein